MEISLDKLPIKRLEAIEENGVERFPTYDSSTLGLNFILVQLYWLKSS